MIYNILPDIKICGIKDKQAIQAAAESGAHYLGFVFYEPSPRYITAEEATSLYNHVPDHMETVGLFVDANIETIKHILSYVNLDLLQLHGKESPETVLKIIDEFSLPVIKAIHINSKKDVLTALDYDDICDFILFDTKVDGLFGGSGHCFDWTLLEDIELGSPWILSGGLNAQNIGKALSYLTPSIIDVSSGVESKAGHKDPTKIKDFIEATLKTS